jgi:NADH-quinone oxidoreductase subunit E
VISVESKAKIEALKAKYPSSRSALGPALELAQREVGYLSPEAMREVAGLLGVPPVEAASVASFYTMFNRRPVGRHVVQVCTNISCSLMGAEHIVDALRRKLGIEVGETTPDGRFTLMTVECLGSCGTAPMMQVDDDYYENLTDESLERILSDLS